MLKKKNWYICYMLISLVLIRGSINGVLVGIAVVIPYVIVAAVLSVILVLMCKFVKNPKITKWGMIVTLFALTTAIMVFYPAKVNYLMIVMV